MKRTILTAVFAFSILVVSACGTSPPVQYYSLELGAMAGQGPESGGLMIGLGPLRVPDYLKRSRLVTRGSGSEVDVHEYSRWVEPVDKAMLRILAAQVDSKVDGAVVLAYPYLEPLDIRYLVLGQVDRFDSDERGQVVLLVQWAVMGDDNKALVAPRRSRYEVRASDAADHGTIAVAMTEALNRFAEDIAEQLNKALP